MTSYTYVETPWGQIRLTSDGEALTSVYFTGQRHEPETHPEWVRNDDLPLLRQAGEELREYFSGKRTTFDVPLKPSGTPFQERVWEALCGIPYGETISYGELARRVGNPAASRAVGLANGKNPLGIIVPCHRVIGASGKLVGYGGGLDRKQRLLDLEAQVSGRVLPTDGALDAPR